MRADCSQLRMSDVAMSTELGSAEAFSPMCAVTVLHRLHLPGVQFCMYPRQVRAYLSCYDLPSRHLSGGESADGIPAASKG